MLIDITDADFATVFTKRFMGGAKAWESVKADARKAAAERLLVANIARQREIAALLPEREGPEWMALQDEFTRLLAEHDELLKQAFPAVTEART